MEPYSTVEPICRYARQINEEGVHKIRMALPLRKAADIRQRFLAATFFYIKFQFFFWRRRNIARSCVQSSICWRMSRLRQKFRPITLHNTYVEDSPPCTPTYHFLPYFLGFLFALITRAEQVGFEVWFKFIY